MSLVIQLIHNLKNMNRFFYICESKVNIIKTIQILENNVHSAQRCSINAKNDLKFVTRKMNSDMSILEKWAFSCEYDDAYEWNNESEQKFNEAKSILNSMQSLIVIDNNCNKL